MVFRKQFQQGFKIGELSIEQTPNDVKASSKMHLLAALMKIIDDEAAINSIDCSQVKSDIESEQYRPFEYGIILAYEELVSPPLPQYEAQEVRETCTAMSDEPFWRQLEHRYRVGELGRPNGGA